MQDPEAGDEQPPCGRSLRQAATNPSYVGEEIVARSRTASRRKLPRANHCMHPPETQIGEPIPHLSALNRPEAADAGKQHPDARSCRETAFELVKGRQSVSWRTRSANGRHHHERDKSHASDPEHNGQDMNGAGYGDIVHPLLHQAASSSSAGPKNS